MEEAASEQAATAAEKGTEALQRVELLRLRFQEGLPIREIANKWRTDAQQVHREYAKARNEFSEALRSVVAFHYHTSSRADIDRECQGLLAIIR